jgi:hypothetical protein
LTIFAAANPALPAGGFKGESKNEIYSALRRSGRFNENVFAHALIPGGFPIHERLNAAWQFMDDNKLPFPLVVKPDAGERGKGVRIVRSLDELTNTISTSECDLIVQEFAGGEEVSIFYYRNPAKSRGLIFSITAKRFPVITGDGVSTIEELILADPRAVALAQKYIDHNHAQIDRVLALDEAVQLIDIGTHSRSAASLDGGRLLTDELESRIDEVCQSYDGFYFGRFDIREPTLADLQMGRNIKIIERNGITSESTNIYDPSYSLFDVFRILFHQWQLAFEIGAENSNLGASQTSVIDLFRLGLGLISHKAGFVQPSSSPLT